MGRDWDVGSTAIPWDVLIPSAATSFHHSFCKAKSSHGWHSDALVAVTNEDCCHLAARQRQHPETESKKPGLSPSAEGGIGWKLPNAEMQGLRLACSKLSLRHLPSPETSLCWEIGKKVNGLLLCKVTSLLGSNYKTRAVAITSLKANREAIEFSSSLISRAWGFCTQLNLSVNGLPTTTWSTSCSLEKTFPQSRS